MLKEPFKKKKKETSKNINNKMAINTYQQLKLKTKQMNKQNRNRLINTENILKVDRSKKGWEDG